MNDTVIGYVYANNKKSRMSWNFLKTVLNIFKQLNLKMKKMKKKWHYGDLNSRPLTYKTVALAQWRTQLYCKPAIALPKIPQTSKNIKNLGLKFSNLKKWPKGPPFA
jgi:hypothetical protein